MTSAPLNLETPCLAHSFYERHTAEVAKSLLGKIFVRDLALPTGILRIAGYITETEAYGYRDDPASHAFSGLRPRNSTMFGKVGCLYVYLVYGKHFCANVTARKNDTKAGAVLIRAILLLTDYDMMNKMIGYSKNLIIGPGRITEAMSITLAHDGVDVTQESSPITVRQGQEVTNFITGRRIGISKAIDRPWRYTVTKFATDMAI